MGMAELRRNWYLMDDIPSPYYAVSSRLIKFGFSGPVMTIRREGDNAEQTFSFVNGGLDTTAINDFIVAGGTPYNGYIKEWYDQLDPANKMIQLTQANQPKYAVNAINSKVGMESVTPVAAVLRLNNNISLNYSTPATMFCVCDVVGNQGAVGASTCTTDDLLANNWCRVLLSGTNAQIQYRDNAGNTSTFGLTPGTGKNIFCIECDGVDTIKFYKNSTLVATQVDPQGFLNTLRNLQVGSFGGFLTEFVVFDTQLNTDNRNRVFDNLNTFYNIY